MANVQLFVVFFAFVAGCLSIDPPVYGDSYRAEGLISLPYAEIGEPFTAYYDAPNKRSRVDYYNVMKTIQKSSAPGYEFGTTYTIAPFTTKTVTNKIGCFQNNGSKDASVDITTVIPDLAGFKYLDTVMFEGVKANTFFLLVANGDKTSTYTFWAAADDNRPLFYEMKGYDTLLGSHFDKYYVTYSKWESPSKFDDSIFSPPESLSCTGFPGPGNSAETKILMNPIREYIHHDDTHVHEAFEKFKVAHKKEYTADEHDSRKHVFRQNLRYIHSRNRAGLTYTMAVNHLADRTDNEMKRMRGYRYTHGERGGKKFSLSDMKVSTLPEQIDWRLNGAVTQVKDQAICGSCWSFGTTGAIEGANFVKHHKLIRLSQNQLIDCSWGYGNNGCDGGEDFRAYHYIMENGGITSEGEYGPYKPIDGYCFSNRTQPVVQISNFTTIPQGDLSALRLALVNKGPVSVAIDAAHKSLSFYANGVYFEPKCRSDPDGLDHAVLAVGYGTLDGQDYWLVKNSWSTYWGNDGYVLMAQRNNNCGVATAATYVDVV